MLTDTFLVPDWGRVVVLRGFLVGWGSFRGYSGKILLFYVSAGGDMRYGCWMVAGYGVVRRVV